VSPEEWLAARKDLLVKEKEATQARDRVNATGGGYRWCASTSRSTGLTARTWSPVSRFTGHARSRHASQTLRRGLLCMAPESRKLPPACSRERPRIPRIRTSP
jgi:hypothetical protein